MRALLAIPHCYDAQSASGGHGRYGSRSDAAAARAAGLSAAVNALQQCFGERQYVMQIVHGRTRAANEPLRASLDVVVCTAGSRHLIDELTVDPAFYQHLPTTAQPPLLGFECHAVLRDRVGSYDWYGYLEDDLVLHDPWLFVKLRWFLDRWGPENVLLPNRFERGTRQLVQKAYIDGDLAEGVTAAWQNVHDQPELQNTVLGRPVVLRRPFNPHSGCFVLCAEQMARWTRQTHFLDRDTSFIGPLESAATLGLMRTFRIYKPARENASFLEIEHRGTRFLDQLRRPDPPESESSDESTVSQPA